MKKNYLFFALLLTSLFLSKLNAQVPNGGFENWVDDLLYSELPPYLTSNFQSYLIIGQANVTEVSGVNDSAVRLETVTDGNEVIPGALVLVEIEGGNFAAGYPFSAQPDSITGNFRYDIPNGDTASILLIFTLNGLPVNFATIPFVGTSTSFTYYAFDLSDFLFPPDSVSIIISSTNFDDPVIGGWIEMDNLVFTNSNDQLPNNGFDDWDDIETEEPLDWTSTNFISALSDSPFAVTKSTDSYSGDFALKLETVEISFSDDEPDTIGYITTGIVGGDEGIEGGFPYSDQPDELTGYYKYTPVGNDTAVVLLSFSKYNSGTGETNSLYEYLIQLPPTSTYTQFAIPISLSEIPDTANVTIGSSNYAEEGNYIGVGSVLFVDDLVFEFADGTSVPLINYGVLIYPNPASDYTILDLSNVKGEIKSVIFFDAVGRKALHLENPARFGNTLNIDTHKLNNGIYAYVIKTDLGDFSGKLQIER